MSLPVDKILIVGAGLTGAALAYAATRRQADVVVVSADRPASQATALAPGVVHGVGPSGAVKAWSSLDDRTLQKLARRALRGDALLKDVLLNAVKPVGIKRTQHELICWNREPSEVIELVARLERSGYEVQYAERSGHPVLVRQGDAVLNTRRLTLELLRQARSRGAELKLRRQVNSIEQPVKRGPVRVGFNGHTPQTFDRVLWAGGWPNSPVLERALDVARARFSRRVVLQQNLERGERPLGRILASDSGEMMICPCPVHPERVTMLRVAGGASERGVTWPGPPEDWARYRGLALRQRLTESIVGPLDRPFHRSHRLFVMTGFCGWSICTVLGACHDAATGERAT